MKKIVAIFIVVIMLLTLTACEKNDGNYPRDDGRRYQNVVDAHFEEENSTKSEVIYEIEIENYVYYSRTGSGGSISGLAYKDEKGYYPMDNINFSGTTR